MSFSAGLEDHPSSSGAAGAESDDDWLRKFHRGDAEVMERCYRDTFAVVERAVGGLLGRADRESIIHDVFSRLLGQPALRMTFRGGSFASWIAVVARHQAIDYSRRLKRETSVGDPPISDTQNLRHESEAAEARILVEKFRRTCLEPSWDSVFETCFLRQMSQREAARMLGLSRTTVAYREMRIRHQLKRYLRDEELP